jgi:hypothetical protein
VRVFGIPTIASLAYRLHPHLKKTQTSKRCKFLTDYFLTVLSMPKIFKQQRSKIVPKILASAAFCLLLACAPSAPEVVKDWQDQGWSLLDVHGTEGPVERYGKLMSKKAQAVEASWVESGKRCTKVYTQTSHFILVLRFFKKNGDQFAVVMKKRK